MSDKTAPNLEDLNPYNEDYQRDPWEMLARLRELSPVTRVDDLAIVALTRAKDIEAVLRDPQMQVNPRKALPQCPFSRLAAEDGSEPSMLFSDDPRHKRLKSLVAAWFTPRAVEQWRTRTVEITEQLLAPLEGEFDLIADFAGPLPTWVIAEMLNVDPERLGWFKLCSDATAYAFFNPMCTEEEKALGERCRIELNEYFHQQIEDRRSNPQSDGDLIAHMIDTQSQDPDLTDEDIVSQCNLLLIAGNITTTDLVGNGVASLLEYREQWELLCAQPELIKSAVEELLRFNPPVTNSGRLAHADGEIDGCPIHKGELLAASLSAANRDPAVVDNPDVLDIRRESIKHWSFGGGRHFCSGAALARMEGQEALLALTKKFPHMQLIEGRAQLRTMPGFRGYTELWVDAGKH